MYESYFGLSRRPFSLTPDRRFLFPSKGHKRALSYLLFGLEQREGFVVITGDVGTGKTLLIQELFAELKQRRMATARIAAANLTAESVLPMVAAAFGRPYEGLGKVSLLRDLEAALQQDQKHADGALLVVDEAQTFSREALEELRILSNFEVSGRSLMQIFLVGQSELRHVLADKRMTQLRQRIIASHHLDPLNRNESQEYIWHRLNTAGWIGDPDLTPELFSAVFEWSNGIPRRINLLMDRLLLFAYLEELHRLDAIEVASVVEELNLEAPEPMAANGGRSDRQDDALPDEQDLGVADVEERLTALEAGFTLLMRHVAKNADKTRQQRTG